MRLKKLIHPRTKPAPKQSAPAMPEKKGKFRRLVGKIKSIHKKDLISTSKSNVEQPPISADVAPSHVTRSIDYVTRLGGLRQHFTRKRTQAEAFCNQAQSTTQCEAPVVTSSIITSHHSTNPVLLASDQDSTRHPTSPADLDPDRNSTGSAETSSLASCTPPTSPSTTPPGSPSTKPPTSPSKEAPTSPSTEPPTSEASTGNSSKGCQKLDIPELSEILEEVHPKLVFEPSINEKKESLMSGTNSLPAKTVSFDDHHGRDMNGIDENKTYQSKPINGSLIEQEEQEEQEEEEEEEEEEEDKDEDENEEDEDDGKYQIKQVVSEHTEQEDGEDEQDQEDEDEKDEQDQGDEDGDEEAETERTDWKAIRQIPDNALRQLLLDTLDDTHSMSLKDTHAFPDRMEGSYNMAVALGLFRNAKVEQYIIRIPANGTVSLWTEADQYMFENQVKLMIHIHLNCPSVPVPNILDYSATLDNALGVPYILMEKLEGEAAGLLWLEDPDADEPWITADSPSSTTHSLRVNFLESLAKIMVELESIKFDQIGLPVISAPHIMNDASHIHTEQITIGHTCHWPHESEPHEVYNSGPFTSTRAYIDAALDLRFGWKDLYHHQDFETDRKLQVRAGARKILDIIFDTEVFNCDNGSEIFTIRHTDLDLQNILVDDEGNVTGIIDWDGAFAAPRCIGTAAVPQFLQKDWFPDDAGELFDSPPHMTFGIDKYRRIYASAFTRAQILKHPELEPKDTDARFTLKSGLYQAAFATLYQDGCVWNFTDKVLREIPEFRADPFTFKLNLGRGWPKAEDWLKPKIAEIFKMELLGLQDLDVALMDQEDSESECHDC